MAYDAFLLGFRVPNLARDLFAEGALSSAFVPTFTEYLHTRSKAEAAELAQLVTTAVIIVVGLVCVIGIIFSPVIVYTLAPGFTEVPGKFEVAVTMTRIMFPFLLLVALAAQAMGILNACGVFGLPALSSAFFNLGSVAFGLTLGYWAGPRLGIDVLEGMAWGVVFGGALQLAVQGPALKRLGFSFRPRLSLSHPGVRRIAGLMGPSILGNSAVQVNVVVNSYFASLIVDPVRGLDGAVSWLAYAFRFMQLPLGLFGVAIAAATLPAISKSAAQGDIDDFRHTLARSLGLVFLLSVPSSVGLIVLGESMIGAIYQTGRFEQYDTHQTAVALSFYSIGLAGYSALKVLTPAFYALGDARTPMVISIASIAINLAVAWLTTRVLEFGHAGLALSTSAVALFSFVALFLILRVRIGGVHGRHLRSTVTKVAAASALMGAVVGGSSELLIGWLGPNLPGRLTDLAVSIPLGLVVVYVACRAFRVAELDLATHVAAGPFRRLFPSRS
jgi:putative peptidoglycan lipid II flippase